MKIKELHLRNIASIECADIDFEADLKDRVTGEPASVFLISGDTGAGKSVILDGISMALYKNTPRIADTKDKNDNKFKDQQGAEINISSIQQYTRNGISEKDECYSEVVFEGNDKRIYRAKLELGYSKEKKNAILKHREIRWTVKVGENDWEKVPDRGPDKGKVIVDAVGLTFEQFGRMAMLAQGQFASFLTGEKKERESILEKLTNTGHFSDYGDAIKNLFSNAEAEKKQAAALLAAELKHTLPAEQVEQYKNEYRELEGKEKELNQQITAVDAKILAVEQIEQSLAAKSKAEEAAQNLEQLRESDEYMAKVQLVDDWDKTVTERQRLKDMQDAQVKLAATKEDEKRLQARFQALSSDLEARKAALVKEETDLANEKAWLDERSGCDALYVSHREILMQLKQYQTNEGKLNDAEKSLAEEKGKTDQLKGILAEAQKSAEAKIEAVVRKQKEIDDVMTKYAALNPAEINSLLDKVAGEKSLLDSLAAHIDDYDRKVGDAEALRKAVNDADEALVRMKSDLDVSQMASEEAKRLYDEAKDRFAVMNASLEETLMGLRKRLVNMHETVCPLCGQELLTVHMEDEFRNMLTPVEEEQEKKKSAFQEADRKFSEDKRAYDIAGGALAEKKRQLVGIVDSMGKSDGNIRAEAQKAGVDIPEPFVPNAVRADVEKMLDALRDEESELKQKQAEATELHNKITVLIDEKKPLDKEKEDAERLRNDAEHNLNGNGAAIDRLSGELERGKTELEDLKSGIDSLLAAYCANWQSDISAVMQTLSAEAETYVANKDKYLKNESCFSQNKRHVEILQGHYERLSPEFPLSQDVADGHRLNNCEDVNKEWTDLIGETGALKSRIQNLSEVISDCRKVLDAYYAGTAKTEDDLVSLSMREHELDGARQTIKETDEQLRSCRDAGMRAAETVQENMRKLGVERPEDVPAKDPLKKDKEDFLGKHDVFVGQMGAIRQKLDDNNDNIAKRDAAEHALADAEKKYSKWELLNKYFGGTKFRSLVQTHILRPLLNNANIYLERITDRYRLTCSTENEKLAILVHDMYNKGQVRSATILSGGERFMISLALSLALSSLNRQDMNVNILFIDEGFGTLDEKSLDSVMATLERLQEIAGQGERRVGIISHREELEERIPVKIMVKKRGQGRSIVEMKYE